MTTLEHNIDGECWCGARGLSHQAAAIYAAMTEACPDLWHLVDDDIFWQNRATKIAAALTREG